MKRLLVAVALAGVSLGVTRTGSADVLHLRNGHEIEGTVIEKGDEVEVKVRFGSVTVRRREVDSIERSATPLELYAQKCARTNLSDPDAVAGLIRWCEEQGLEEQARALREVARGAALERRLVAVRPGNAEELYELAMWAAAQGYGPMVERYILEKCVQIAPEHEAARRALGQTFYEGAWRPAEEAARLATGERREEPGAAPPAAAPLAAQRQAESEPRKPARGERLRNGGELVTPVQPLGGETTPVSTAPEAH
jgi:hypothetical protein